MSFDQIAVDRGDAVYEQWAHALTSSSAEITKLVAQYFQAPFRRVVGYLEGSFNVCVRVEAENGPDAIIRFPKPGIMISTNEKVRNEVAVMKFLARHTTIPIPRLIGWGLSHENPCDLGPFIIMEFVEGKNLSDVLKRPGASQGDPPLLDPNIHESTLGFIYAQIADILLQLSEHNFDCIGAIPIDEGNSYPIRERPWTYNMNELATVGDYPIEDFLQQSFSTTSEYLEELASQHLHHLRVQPNIVKDPNECCEKYLARHLFSLLAQQSCKIWPEHENGPFKLFCDDLRPSNILVNDSLEIKAVLDWEFTYAAPAQFAYSPPWWLLLRGLDSWVDNDDLDGFLHLFLPRFHLFLRVLKAREDQTGKYGNLGGSQRLSNLMEASMENGTFWFNLAARKSWDVDRIFWRKLERRFLHRGDSTDFMADPNTQKGLEFFTNMKMGQLRDYYERRLAFQ